MGEESRLESYLCRRMKQWGGLSLKWVSPGFTGVPDRILIFPDGTIVFAELKATKGVLSKRQEVVIRQLRQLGCWVEVIRSKEDIEHVRQKQLARLPKACSTTYHK